MTGPTSLGPGMQLSDVIAGRYELTGVVGNGGMSTVYCARDRLLDRRVALKILHERFARDAEYVERFRREARSVARLSHPNIVTVIDRGEENGRQFIVFEFVDGENLKEVLADGPLPVARALEIAIACADALSFAHENGLIHRDMKPHNVLVDTEGHVKVTDFGIARSVDVDVDADVTQTGTVLGTSSYLSPEQARGQAVTAASDIYSLGIVLWEMLAGDVPFPGDSFVAVALQHVNEPPPSLLAERRDTTPRLARAVERALAKQPEDRFPSMADFAEELRRCLRTLDEPEGEQTLVGVPAVSPAAPVPGRAAPPARRRLWPALLILVAAVAILAGLLGLHQGGGGGATGKASAGGGSAVTLSGVGDYDPQGSGSEHADTAQLATDGDPSTFWYTETYASPTFGNLKPGLGLVLDAGGATKLSRLTVQTPTPGFTARIMAGDSPTGPFASDSTQQTVNGATTFDLAGRDVRYYVVWITQLPPGNKAEISEVSAAR